MSATRQKRSFEKFAFLQCEGGRLTQLSVYSVGSVWDFFRGNGVISFESSSCCQRMALAIVAAAAPIHKHCNLYDYRGGFITWASQQC
jgi:hypothetical protein